jgi:hypothetical protein
MFDAETREPIEDVFFCNTGKKLARYAFELWNNAIGEGVSPKATLDTSWNSGMKTGEFAVVTGAFQLLYQDPMDPSSPKVNIDGGQLIGVLSDVFIQTPQGRFYFVQKSPKGKGWMLQDSFQIAFANSLWKLGCAACVGNQGPIPPC